MSAEKLGYLRGLLFATGSPAGTAVNLAIFLLFLIGLLDVLVVLLWLGKERRALRAATAKLAAAVAASAEPAADRFARFAIGGTSLVSRRVAQILELRGAGLRHHGTLRELADSRLAGSGSLARYIGAILTLMGLLGTVLGLSFALFNIQTALGRVSDVAAFNELVRALGETLLGMRTAFACTLAGLGTALALSAGNHAVSRAQARLEADLEELVACRLLPALERADPAGDGAALAFAQLLVEAGRDLDRWREQAATAANVYAEASQRLSAGVVQFNQSLAELNQGVAAIAASQREVADASRDTGNAVRLLADSGEAARTFLGGLATQHQEALASQLRTSQEAYETSLGRHRQELEEVVERSRDSVAGLAAAQGAALTAASDLILDVHRHLSGTGLAEVASHLAAALDGSQAILRDLRGVAARFEPAVLAGQQQLKVATEAALQEVRSALTQALADLSRQQLDGIASQVSSLERALAASLARHDEILQRATERGQETMRGLIDAQGATLHAFTDLVSDLHGRMGPLFDRLSPAGGNGRDRQAAAPVAS